MLQVKLEKFCPLGEPLMQLPEVVVSNHPSSTLAEEEPHHHRLLEEEVVQEHLWLVQVGQEEVPQLARLLAPQVLLPLDTSYRRHVDVNVLVALSALKAVGTSSRQPVVEQPAPQQ